jgi:hypothetical protein
MNIQFPKAKKIRWNVEDADLSGNSHQRRKIRRKRERIRKVVSELSEMQAKALDHVILMGGQT